MNKSILKYIILLSLLLCLAPAQAYADNSITGSFTVGGNTITLAVGDPTYTSLTLTWNSPQLTPGWGPATQYDIRYSLSPITTEAEWQAAIQLATPPTPQPPGSPETLLVIGLNPCTTYYFAIKAADATGTWTPLSNTPQGTTLCYSGGGGGGGGGQGSSAGGLSASFYACPLTLTADVQGNITTASMTKDGVLCEACLAKDSSGKNTLELDKDTKVMLAGNIVPLLLKVKIASNSLPTDENTMIVGPVYEFAAYASASETTPSPIAISPSARLILSYDPSKLPEKTTEVFIDDYDSTKGWLPLTPVPGAVAEIGKAHGLLNHFSLFAVLAKFEEAAPAKFEVSNLTVSPTQTQLNQEITVSVNVANTGGKNGDYSLELKIDGAVKSTTQVTVAAGKSQVVNFTTTGDTAGKHQVEVAGLVGEFEVIKASVPSVVNWWLIGGITVLVLAIWSILGWRWFKDRKKTAPASAAIPTDKSTESCRS
ncbi:MAG: fibronectin type III domain-containing protein [Dehalococcoidia bacterium]|jgi:hypothetical protein